MGSRIPSSGWLIGVIALGLGMAGGPVPAARSDSPVVEVYKSASCGCCTKWVDHLRAHGFTVRPVDVADVGPVKRDRQVPEATRSCHTALVDGYFVEGHVPAEDLARLLRERPDIAGLAVPGMPIGSPGMEGPRPEPYDVLAVGRDGTLTPFSSHGPGTPGSPRGGQAPPGSRP